MLFRPSAHGDLTGLIVVSGKEDPKRLAVATATLTGEARSHLKKVEGRRLRQAIQAQPEHAVKNEVLERICRHVRRGYEPHAHAVGSGLACHGDVGTHLITARTPLSKAQLVLDENAGDFARTEGHCDLITGFPSFDTTPIPVNVLCSGGRTSPVPAVNFASFRMTVRAWKYQVSAASVKDHCEWLRRSAKHNRAIVGALVMHNVVDDVNLLL
mmetsp:Transcript_103938/g.247387  ORF Transcript_103938/g.247387 Transcript_103938/m.247387 type:complete len:213 (-) Transcript_103938:682-1320(-)